mmetsp:Transcript_26976/g.39687  ORF Transcript_26976/g.39687 Transcript_26976/m.39687 type:complete len:126 (-) Transcript_26976:218-595(-)
MRGDIAGPIKGLLVGLRGATQGLRGSRLGFLPFENMAVKREGDCGGAGPITLGEEGGGGIHPAKTPALGDLGVRTDGAGCWRGVVVAEVLVERGEEALCVSLLSELLSRSRRLWCFLSFLLCLWW